MSLEYDIVSIGCLSHNRFWDERQPVRASHATTTLVRDAGQSILVDPSLPVEVLGHRLDERTGLKPEQVDCVFLTSFQPIHRRGLAAFERADWLMGQAEIDAYTSHLTGLLSIEEDEDHDDLKLVREELALLERIKPAPEKLTGAVHLFPSPGVTSGSCGLLLTPSTLTIAIAGDAVINRDYLERGRIFERCADTNQAAESLADYVEVADQIICGHDNLVMCRPHGL
jgi:glyoxylase-like metal-dependent hydrolase (beta-lactamase superfamily II)